MTAAPEPAEVQVTDGRRLRRAGNRDAVVAALVEIFAEGSYFPSAAEIAGRSGLSPRSLFRYFDDIDDLCRTAIDQILEGAWHLVPVEVPEHAGPAERVRLLASRRCGLFEAIAPASRAARAWAHRNPVVGDHVLNARRYLDAQTGRVLAPVVGGEPGRLAAACVLLSFEGWELLRTSHGLDADEVVGALVTAVTAIVGIEPTTG